MGFTWYVGFRSDESTWQFMDTGARGPGDWIDFERKQYFEYRKAHPEVETQDRPYDDFDENRRGRDFSPSIRTQQTQVLAAFKAGVPISLGMDPLYVGGIGNAIEFLIEGGFTPMDGCNSCRYGGRRAKHRLRRSSGNIGARPASGHHLLEGQPTRRALGLAQDSLGDERRRTIRHAELEVSVSKA